MKRQLRFFLIIAVAFAIGAPFARATEEKEETLGDKFKRLFVRPTQTPKPRKKKKTSPASSPAASQSPSLSVDETPISSSSAPESSATASESASATSTPSAAPEIQATATPEKSRTQYFEAVRPISPHGSSKRTPSTKAAPAMQTTPIPTMTVAPEIPNETPEIRPMPSLPAAKTPTPPTLRTPAPSATGTPTPSPIAKKTPPPAALIDEISDSANYSPELRKIVDLSLDLTTKNLGYKYVSAEPKNGGMDSSGFIYYVLTQSGVKGVPRDAREQYIWVRKAGNFQAVLAQRDDTFELDALKPGDLLFWASNYGVSRDPDISQTMIYLGREKGTNQRLMVGASESRSSKGPKKPGVGVFEFKVGRASAKSSEEKAPVFVGYGRIPGAK